MANDQRTTYQPASAQRAVEWRRSAQHGGVHSNGWLGITCEEVKELILGCPNYTGLKKCDEIVLRTFKSFRFN